MALLDLPQEILLRTVQYLPDTSVLKFGLSSRLCYQIVARELAEYRFYLRYDRVVVGVEPPTPMTPISVVDLIIQDPKVARYIRELVYFDIEYGFCGLDDMNIARPLFERHDWLRPQFRQLIEAGVLSQGESTQLMRGQETGYWGITWLILFSMLPNLETVAFSLMSDNFDDMIYVLLRYAHCKRFVQQRTQQLGQLRSSQPEIGAFKLPSPTTLKLDCSEIPFTRALSLHLTRLCLLPSIRIVEVSGLSDYGADVAFDWCDWNRLSPGPHDVVDIETANLDINGVHLSERDRVHQLSRTIDIIRVEFSQSNVSPDNLLRMMRGWPNLRTLLYHRSCSVRPMWCHRADPWPSVANLIESSGEYVRILRDVGASFFETQGFDARVVRNGSAVEVYKTGD